MRTFYIMAATAVVAILVVMAIVISSGWEEHNQRARRNTTTAVEGSRPDCASLSGTEQERCLAQQGQDGTGAGGAPQGR